MSYVGRVYLLPEPENLYTVVVVIRDLDDLGGGVYVEAVCVYNDESPTEITSFAIATLERMACYEVES